MAKRKGLRVAQDAAEARVDHFRRGLGPFVVAAESTRMPMIFTDGQIRRHPVVFANDSFLLLTGFDRAEILGKGVDYLLKEVADASTRSAIELALDDGLHGTWEARCRRSNGDEYLATVFLSPVPDDEGIVRQNFLSFVEISSRTDQLLAQRDQFNALYEQAPGFIAVLAGKEHRFAFANAAFKRLVGRELLIDRTVTQAIPEAVEQGFVALLDKVFETGEPFVATSIPIRFAGPGSSDPGPRYLNFVYQPVRDSTARITGVFVEGYDITTERLAAEQLSLLQGEVAHASRVNAMGMMAATLAHELNQPLTAILNYAAAGAHLIDPNAPHASVLAETLDAIEDAAQRAGDIIRNVRELTRRGRTPRTSFDVATAVAECINLVRAGGSPTATIDDRTPRTLVAMADRLQIQQVVINLLRNACSAAGETPDGRVTVDAAVAGETIVVSVSDTGPGIALEAADDLFRWSVSAKPGGMGLGLSISRAMIEAQDGQIWVEKSDPSGSQFCFSVPAAGADTGVGNHRRRQAASR